MVLMTSRLISARISVERMLASSAKFRPWIALEGLEFQWYSALEALDLAFTVTFSIEKAIWLKALLLALPSRSVQRPG